MHFRFGFHENLTARMRKRGSRKRGHRNGGIHVRPARDSEGEEVVSEWSEIASYRSELVIKTLTYSQYYLKSEVFRNFQRG